MNPPRPHLFGLLAGLYLATGLCLAALLLARAWTRIAESQVVNVTGSARMGVVQINPLYSTSASWEGNNDTDSLEKTITATFTLR